MAIETIEQRDKRVQALLDQGEKRWRTDPKYRAEQEEAGRLRLEAWEKGESSPRTLDLDAMEATVLRHREKGYPSLVRQVSPGAYVLSTAERR